MSEDTVTTGPLLAPGGWRPHHCLSPYRVVGCSTAEPQASHVSSAEMWRVPSSLLPSSCCLWSTAGHRCTAQLKQAAACGQFQLEWQQLPRQKSWLFDLALSSNSFPNALSRAFFSLLWPLPQSEPPLHPHNVLSLASKSTGRLERWYSS